MLNIATTQKLKGEASQPKTNGDAFLLGPLPEDLRELRQVIDQLPHESILRSYSQKHFNDRIRMLKAQMDWLQPND